MNQERQDPGADEAALFVSLPWPAAAIDAEGFIVAANPAFESFFPGCLTGETRLDAIFDPDERGVPAHESLPMPERPGESWQGKRRATGRDTYRLLVVRDTAHESLRWMFLPENPVVSGRATLTPRSEMDITRMVLEHSPDFIFLRDTSGAFIFAGRAMTRFLGVPSDGYETGKRLSEFLTADCRREFEKFDRETLDSREPSARHRFRIETSAGMARLLDIVQEPVFNKAGNLLGIISFARDITAVVDRENRLHLALAEARSAGEAKGFFVANVSHEIRTPINGILGMAELCLDTELTTEQRKYVQSVLDCGRTLLTLVNDILDFSKIESGRLVFESIEFDLVGLLAEVVAQFSPKAHEKGVEVVLDADPDLPARFRGDPTRVRQIAYNLLSNAIKFTSQGHVVVSARALGRIEGRMRVAVEVADTGIGIPQEKLADIFESFTQADATTTRRFGGTGLGLAIVKRLVEMMRGEIGVRSKPGEGSAFVAEMELDIARDKDEAQGVLLASRRIGVLSPDPVQREALARTLRALGADVIVSPGGVDAFRLVMAPAHGVPKTDLLVADYPVSVGKGSHEMADIIVGRAASSAIPVMTLSGMKTEPRALARIRGLPHGHLTKPATPAELRALALALLGIVDPERTESAPTLAASRRVLRILLAEDNPVNRELALRRLEKLGHQTDSVADGGAAWGMLTSKRYDVAMLDVQMPVLDGIRLAKRIREMETGASVRLPLVALTALAMDSDRKACLDAGFDAFLSKPFLLEDMRKVLDGIAPPHTGDPADIPPTKATRPPIPRRASDTFDFAQVLRDCSPHEADDLLAAGEIFLSYWEKEIAALDEARENGDRNDIALIAHRIKGGVGSLRARAAFEAASALETATRTAPPAEVDARLSLVVESLESTAEGIREALRARRPPDA